MRKSTIVWISGILWILVSRYAINRTNDTIALVLSFIGCIVSLYGLILSIKDFFKR